MAYPGEYAQTSGQGQGHWYDLLKSLLSGLQGAGRGIGQGVGAVGQGAASALSSVGPQLPEILKILGSIGKGVGQTATMVGRQLPYAGPLIQAGEYGILNAVGKEDSPWAQGNAFVQRDVAQEQQRKMAELMQRAKELGNIGTQQENEQRAWDLTQNPLKERETQLGIQNKEQDYQKGEFEIEALKQERDKLADVLKVMPYNVQAQKSLEEINKRIELLGAQIADEKATTVYHLSLAGKADKWTPTGPKPPMTVNQIEANAKRYADTHTPGMAPGLAPPMQDKAVYESWMRNVIFYKKSVNQGIDPDTGESISTIGGTATNQGMIPPGGTANLPAPPPPDNSGLQEQMGIFSEYLTKNNLDPQTALGQLIVKGMLNPADPMDKETIDMIKKVYKLN